jgi:hypothetical protein
MASDCSVLGVSVPKIAPCPVYSCGGGKLNLTPKEAREPFRRWFNKFEGALFLGRVTAIETDERFLPT